MRTLNMAHMISLAAPPHTLLCLLASTKPSTEPALAIQNFYQSFHALTNQAQHTCPPDVISYSHKAPVCGVMLPLQAHARHLDAPYMCQFSWRLCIVH